eukprot:m.12293 g.12293  ORF g.12293 m.12293 type:complete len:411 (+) comp2715_c0_seq2:542-1774(+)
MSNPSRAAAGSPLAPSARTSCVSPIPLTEHRPFQNVSLACATTPSTPCVGEAGLSGSVLEKEFADLDFDSSASGFLQSVPADQGWFSSVAANGVAAPGCPSHAAMDANAAGRAAGFPASTRQFSEAAARTQGQPQGVACDHADVRANEWAPLASAPMPPSPFTHPQHHVQLQHQHQQHQQHQQVSAPDWYAPAAARPGPFTSRSMPSSPWSPATPTLMGPPRIPGSAPLRSASPLSSSSSGFLDSTTAAAQLPVDPLCYPTFAVDQLPAPADLATSPLSATDIDALASEAHAAGTRKRQLSTSKEAIKSRHARQKRQAKLADKDDDRQRCHDKLKALCSQLAMLHSIPGMPITALELISTMISQSQETLSQRAPTVAAFPTHPRTLPAAPCPLPLPTNPPVLGYWPVKHE